MKHLLFSVSFVESQDLRMDGWMDLGGGGGPVREEGRQDVLHDGLPGVALAVPVAVGAGGQDGVLLVEAGVYDDVCAVRARGVGGRGEGGEGGGEEG